MDTLLLQSCDGSVGVGLADVIEVPALNYILQLHWVELVAVQLSITFLTLLVDLNRSLVL